MKEFKTLKGEIVGKIVDNNLEIFDPEKLCHVLFSELINTQGQAITKIQSLEKNNVSLKEALKALL